MRAKTIAAPLVAMLVAATTVLTTAAPAAANTCTTATPMGSGGEMGTVTTTGSVGAVFEPDDWWEHSTNITNRTVSATTPTGGQVTITVYDSNCSNVLCGPVATPNACGPNANLPSGLLKIKVSYSAFGGQSATNYTLTATGFTPSQCSDGTDNDGDGTIDYGSGTTNDRNCTSPNDDTEAPVHIAAYGHVTVRTNAAGLPEKVLSGVYADTSAFRCDLSTSPYVQVVCTEQFNPEVSYDCTHFILTATAPSPAQSGSGNVSGYLKCANPSVLRTGDVYGSGSSQADNMASGVNLGEALTVTCRAAGVGGAALPSGSYQVDCYEPGVAWPYGPSPL